MKQPAPMRAKHSQAVQRAIQLEQQGKLDKAGNLYKAILATQPNNFDALYRFGALRYRQGGTAEALEYIGAALKVRPGHAMAWSDFGLVLATLGRAAEALASYDRALALDPACAEALHNRGSSLLDLMRAEEALASYDRALALAPCASLSLNGRGAALLVLNRPDEALASFDKALVLKPHYVEALNNRGIALRELNCLEEALTSYNKALALKPAYAEALNNRGCVLAELNRPEGALASYDKALAIKPDYATAYEGKAVLLSELGRFNEASDAIEKAIEIAPLSARFYHSLTESKRLARSDSHFRAMEKLAQNMPLLDANEQIYLHFALAKAYADIDDHERSFQWLLDGNALKRKQLAYDEPATLEVLERTRAAFTSELMHRNHGAGDPSSVPVFVLGMPRSGTTLIEQILASHPKVFGAGEINDFSTAMMRLHGLTGDELHLPEDVSIMSGDQLRNLGATYVGRITAAAPTAERITNKTVENFRLIGLINLALPNARIIHARRDPVDTCLSCYSKLFVGKLPYTYDLKELGRYYRAYEVLMKHWRCVLPRDVMLEVQYEEVVTDLEGQARRIVSHCGLEWDARCLDFHQTERQVRTASKTQVRQPIYKSSVGRWHAYQSLTQTLCEAMQAPIERSYSPACQFAR
jgi:tetratricopeptide (TPR) repeat protein